MRVVIIAMGVTTERDCIVLFPFQSGAVDAVSLSIVRRPRR